MWEREAKEDTKPLPLQASSSDSTERPLHFCCSEGSERAATMLWCTLTKSPASMVICLDWHVNACGASWSGGTGDVHFNFTRTWHIDITARGGYQTTKLGKEAFLPKLGAIILQYFWATTFIIDKINHLVRTLTSEEWSSCRIITFSEEWSSRIGATSR